MMTDPLEPVIVLKRQRSTHFTRCLICQDLKAEKLNKPSEQGLKTVKEAADIRRKLRDTSNRETLDRISDVFDDDSSPSVLWHKSCYSSLTSKTHISRLAKKCDLPEGDNTPQKSALSKSSSTRLRSSILPTNWNMCMFCQSDSNDKISSVTTVKMSDQILEYAPFDKDAIVRLANVNDLIAAEGKYHHVCLKKFLRSTTNIRQKAGAMEDIAMQWLIDDLRVAAEQAKVIELSVVWDRYCDLADKAGLKIPSAFCSRRSSFKDKLKLYIGDAYEFVVMRNRPVEERQTLLIPRKFLHIPVSQIKESTDDSIGGTTCIPTYQPDNDWYMEMIHVALKIRSDIMEQPSYEGLSVCNETAISCIPDALYMFVNLVLGGSQLLDNQDDDEVNDSKHHNHVLSIAQDFIYNASGGKKWTPKHVGLGCALHQATRSKNLVRLFHKSGHTIDYESILRIDKCMAEETLKTMDSSTGAVVPPNLNVRDFVHFTCDNIDISDSNLDGKDSFHATQVAAWQRGKVSDMGLSKLSPDSSTSTTLEIPDVMDQLIPANIVEGKSEMKSVHATNLELFKPPEVLHAETRRANATDMAFFILRQREHNKSIGWTSFNERLTTVNHDFTNVGYLPILLSPAHDIDTLNTVVQRCKFIAKSLGQHYVVLTTDEALYCKLMDLKWSKPAYQEFLILRLGGLHIAMNFLKIIGQHVQSSGIMESWVDSGLVGPRVAELLLNGKKLRAWYASTQNYTSGYVEIIDACFLG